MPTFFFQIEGTEPAVADRQGVVFDSPEAAMAEARAGAREIAADSIRGNEPIADRCIQVLDDAGRLVGAIAIKDVVK